MAPRFPHRLLAAVTAALALALVAPGLVGAQPDPDQGFGYNIQSLVRATGTAPAPSFTPSQWPTFLDAMVRDGLRVGRTDALWRPAEPQAPVGGVHRYDWTTADGVAAGLAREGVRWDVVLDGSPAWASVAPGDQYAAPTAAHFADYAAFAAAFAARYGDGGSFWAQHPELPQLPVRHFEIWNEPNTEVHWGAPPDAAAYASLFRQAQAAIKAVDAQADVVVGGIVWNDDVAYLRAFFGALGPGVTVDGLGSHPYAPTVFSFAANVVRVRQALDALGRADVPLEINELGWPAAYDRAPALHGVDGPVSDAARAATMGLAVDALTASTCDVSTLVVYDLVEAEDDPTHVESLMGLYRRDGSATQTAQALRDAIGRYRQLVQGPPAPPVPMCGARGAKATRVLPMGLRAAPAASGCTQATVTYRGLPLEEAQVRVLAPFRGVKSTDANGQALICPPAPLGRRALRLSADVPGVAGSNLAECVAGRCRTIGPGAACSTRNVALPAVGRLRVALRRGLRVATAGCDPELGAPTTLRVNLVLSRAVAVRAGLRAHAATVAVGAGKALVLPGRRAVATVRFTARARRLLAHARRLTATVVVTAAEGGTRDRTTRTVTLR